MGHKDWMQSSKLRKTRRVEREAKALAAKDRRAWTLVAATIGGVVAYFLFLAAGSGPLGHPEQLVRAQIAHGRTKPRVNSLRATTSSSGRTTPKNDQGYYAADFAALSGFPFTVTAQMVDGSSNSARIVSEIMEQIPGDVKALDEKAVSLKGFMLPVRLQGSQTTEFLLLKNQTLCCYGVTPKITEWVNVLMKGSGVKVKMDEPVSVCGIFHVGEFRENGELVGIYRLDGDMIRPGKD